MAFSFLLLLVLSGLALVIFYTMDCRKDMRETPQREMAQPAEAPAEDWEEQEEATEPESKKRTPLKRARAGSALLE